MAVAVKNPEASPHSRLDNLAVRCSLGVAYVLVSIAVVFYGIPAVWWSSITVVTGILGPFVDAALFLIAMGAGIVGAAILGSRLLGPNQPEGFRGGVFTGLAALALAGFLTWAVGSILDSWLGESGVDGLGQIVTLLLAVSFFGLAGWWYFKPQREVFFVKFEEQGWFSASFYKKAQGLKVRRGTMVAVLLIAGAGIYTLDARNILVSRQSPDWEVSIPFTGEYYVKSTGDVKGANALTPGAWVTRQTWQQAIDSLEGHQRIIDPKDTDLNEGQIVTDAELQKIKKGLTNEEAPTSRRPEPPTGQLQFATIWLLKDVRYSLLLILALASLWFAFRLVNYPVFADFLIATEAELNKVSWSTRKRLVQDTIVVLTTVILLTLFLFVVDLAWHWLLSREVIGVVPQQQEITKEAGKGQEW